MPDITFSDLSEDDINILTKIKDLLKQRNIEKEDNNNYVRIYDLKTNDFYSIRPIIAEKKICLRQTANVEIAVFIICENSYTGGIITSNGIKPAMYPYIVYICDKGDLDNFDLKSEYILRSKIRILAHDIKAEIEIFKSENERWKDDNCFIHITSLVNFDEAIENKITYEYINKPQWVRI